MTKSKKSAAPKGLPAIDAADGMRVPAAKDNNIRNWRLFRQISTQGELAELTRAADPKGKGLERVCIVRLESGAVRYNQDHIDLLAKALGVSPGDLISTNPYDAGDIFAVYAGLTAEDKRKAARFLKGLKRSKK